MSYQRAASPLLISSLTAALLTYPAFAQCTADHGCRVSTSATLRDSGYRYIISLPEKFEVVEGDDSLSLTRISIGWAALLRIRNGVPEDLCENTRKQSIESGIRTGESLFGDVKVDSGPRWCAVETTIHRSLLRSQNYYLAVTIASSKQVVELQTRYDDDATKALVARLRGSLLEQAKTVKPRK